MPEHPGLVPPWQCKFSEGKMFERMECERCHARYNFGAAPRATRIPRCPACGSYSSHRHAV